MRNPPGGGLPATCLGVPSFEQERTLDSEGSKRPGGAPGGEGGERWVILFDSIHHVMAAERTFQESGVWCDLTPTPRDLSSDCGMAIEFRGCDVAATRSVVASLQVPPRSVHRVRSGAHEDVTPMFLASTTGHKDTDDRDDKDDTDGKEKSDEISAL
jgi:hypothetical protein